MRLLACVIIGAVPLLVSSACSTFTSDDSPGVDDAATDSTSDADARGAATEDGGRDVVAPDAGVRRRVFVTSRTYPPSQLASAGSVFDESDGLCNQLAQALTPPGKFQAWISDGNVPANSRNIFMPPYWDVTGAAPVFGAGGSFSAAALTSETRAQAPLTWWTGMATPNEIGDTCESWHADADASSKSYGSVGSATNWFGSTGGEDHACSSSFSALLCFEQ